MRYLGALSPPHSPKTLWWARSKHSLSRNILSVISRLLQLILLQVLIFQQSDGRMDLRGLHVNSLSWYRTWDPGFAALCTNHYITEERWTIVYNNTTETVLPSYIAFAETGQSWAVSQVSASLAGLWEAAMFGCKAILHFPRPRGGGTCFVSRHLGFLQPLSACQDLSRGNKPTVLLPRRVARRGRLYQIILSWYSYLLFVLYWDLIYFVQWLGC